MYYGERFNSITHLVGAVLALIGFGVLLTISLQAQDLPMIIGFSVFGVTLVLLYTMSTLYHSFSPRRVKSVFQKLDHVSIYLLIAGTYTPYLLVVFEGMTQWVMMILIWTLAIVGLCMDLFIKKRIEWLQVLIYLSMGWVCLFTYSDLKAALPTAGLIWLVIGGVAYTGGIIFYALDEMKKMPHAHGVWHLFVMAGSISHFISIAFYVR